MEKVTLGMLVLLSLFFPSNMHAQNLEFGGGLNFNKFFDYGHSEYNPTFGSGGGFQISIGLREIKTKKRAFGFEFNILQYSGNFKTNAFGWTYSESHTVNVTNTTIGITLLPVKIKMVKEKLRLEFGLNGAFVVHSEIDGVFSWTHTYSSPYKGSRVIGSGTESPFVLSAVGRCSYNFKLNEQWVLAPRLNYLVGIMWDYDYEQRVRKMLTCLDVIIIRKF